MRWTPFGVTAAVAIVALLIAFLGFVFQWFWNTTVIQVIDGTHEVNYFQAVKLMLFISIFLLPSGRSSK
jgi:hypothetical protein